MQEAKIDKLLLEFNQEELREIFTSTKIDSSRVSIPLFYSSNNSNAEKKENQILWLHLKIKRDCKLVYAKYTYAAKVTTDKRGKNRFKVDEIILDIHPKYGDGSHYDKKKKNTSRFTHREEVYAKNACGKTKCVATATYLGKSWATKSSL